MMDEIEWNQTADAEYQARLESVEQENDAAQYEAERIRDEEMIKQWEEMQ